MGQTLTNGVYLPDEGERNCYTGLAANWRALDAHLGDANIHVTYEDKEAWNNHVADTVKHVTAEDKTKWDAVTSKADDASVMHLTGDETADGNKTFNGNTNCVGELNQTTSFKMTSDTSFVTGSKNTRIYDQNGFQCANDLTIYNNSKNIRRAWTVNNNSSGTVVSAGFNFILSASGQKVFYPITDSDTDNGSSSAYWKNTYTKLVNGLNPGVLGIPNYQLRSDISAYITDLTGNNNVYTPTADGFVFVRSDNATYLSMMDVPSGVCQVSRADTANVTGSFFPVQKGRSIYIKIICTSLNIAYFIPSQGNI